MKYGLLPLCQEGILIGETSTYEYSGDVADQEESEKLSRALGPTNKILILPNFGIMACGYTIEDAYLSASQIMTACNTQVNVYILFTFDKYFSQSIFETT